MTRVAGLLAVLSISLAPTLYAQTWKYLGLGGEAIHQFVVDPIDAHVVYAAGFGIFRTNNLGESWDTLLTGRYVWDLAIDPVDHNIVYAAMGGGGYSTSGGIAKSTDAGKSWMKADSGIYKYPDGGPQLLAIDPRDPRKVYAGIGGIMSGGLYKSTNAGAIWFSIDDSLRFGDGVTAIAVHPESTEVIYASDVGKGVFRSGDGGLHWIIIGLENRIIYDIEFGCSSSTLYVGASLDVLPGGFFSTSDGGATWHNHTMGLPDTVRVLKIQTSCQSASTQVFIANGWTNGAVFQTGHDWIWKSMGLNLPAGASTIALVGNMLYVGASGVYATLIVTSVDGKNIAGPAAALSQNYPNPFNPSTTIRYALSGRTHVTLTVFNTLGQQAATLVNETQEAGYHDVRFDGTGFASGVYFYRLKAGDFIQSKKLLILR